MSNTKICTETFTVSDKLGTAWLSIGLFHFFHLNFLSSAPVMKCRLPLTQ